MSKDKSNESIYDLTDKELNKYIEEGEYCNEAQMKIAIAESHRRQLKKIRKTTIVTWITFGIVVSILIISVLKNFFFK